VDQEAIQRVTTENATLKQRVRQLTHDNRALEEPLKVLTDTVDEDVATLNVNTSARVL
jgi:hypothetical protein